MVSWADNYSQKVNNCFIVLFQFTSWVDAVIFVFSLENEASFNTIYGYYTKMAHYRNSANIPLILVGTQGLKHFLILFWYTFREFNPKTGTRSICASSACLNAEHFNAETAMLTCTLYSTVNNYFRWDCYTRSKGLTYCWGGGEDCPFRLWY